MANGEALADQIVVLRRAGKLPTGFRVKHIRPHFQNQFCETHIATVLANYCEKTGDQVKRGRRPRFRRVSRGAYETI
jgi:hypothetical protein